MARISAGILLYRRINKQLEVLLVHPGGPYFIKKDIGAWSIPKGEAEEGEELLDVAKREFKEETGVQLSGECLELKPVKQKGGKTVHAWAVEGDIDTQNIVSNTFTIEWPPKSGKIKAFPEIDRAAWYTISEAKEKINAAQAAIIDELAQLLQ